MRQGINSQETLLHTENNWNLSSTRHYATFIELITRKSNHRHCAKMRQHTRGTSTVPRRLLAAAKHFKPISRALRYIRQSLTDLHPCERLSKSKLIVSSRLYHSYRQHRKHYRKIKATSQVVNGYGYRRRPKGHQFLRIMGNCRHHYKWSNRGVS